MPAARTLNVVGVHTGGEVCDVIVGGVLDVPGKTMYEKMMHIWTKQDDLRQVLLNEPRGCAAMCTNLVLPPTNPEADAGFIVMEHEEYPPMSGANTIATTTALLETGMIPMQEPISRIKLDTPAGLVGVTAECENGKVKTAAFDNVPAFVFALNVEIPVPDLGTVRVDIAWGGMIFAIVDATSLNITLESKNGAKLVQLGERIKKAVMANTNPVHPENPDIRGVSIVEFTEPFLERTQVKTAVNTVVVSPGRLDRSPCGTGTCARLALLHARGLLEVNEPFCHRSIIGSEFEAHIRGTAKVGDYPAVLPTVKGSAWISAYKQVVIHPTDPFPQGFRVGDVWHDAPLPQPGSR
jgi:proline racemase